MDETQFSLILNITTGVLLLISELLGLSKCQANGIIDLIVSNLQCLRRLSVKESTKEPGSQDHIVAL